MSAMYQLVNLLKRMKLFSVQKRIQTERINLCGSCDSWRFVDASSKSLNSNVASVLGSTGLCVGRGSYGMQTQSDDKCLMWEPVF
jgi:glutamine amidotransferase PdxT